MSTRNRRSYTYLIKLKDNTSHKVEATKVVYTELCGFMVLITLYKGSIPAYCAVLDKISEIVNLDLEKKSTLGVVNGFDKSRAKNSGTV